MRPLTCTTARRRLQAFCDGQLSVSEQIAVDAHLDWCTTCAASLAEIRLVGATLRRVAMERGWLSRDESAALTATIINRRKAEQDTSLPARVRRMFDDMRVVYSALGASVATVVCVAVLLGMMQFATDGRPDSLAALVDLVAMPGPNVNTAVVDPASQARWTARFQAASASAEEEAVFALDAILTRDDRLASLKRLRTAGDKAGHDEANSIEALLDAVNRARIEPDSLEGTRAGASGMVWLVARTTVRATRTEGVDLPLPRPDKSRTEMGHAGELART
jgi:hypothetical protein